MREMRFFRSMHRLEYNDSIPRVGVFKTARNNLVAAQIRGAISAEMRFLVGEEGAAKSLLRRSVQLVELIGIEPTTS